MAPWSQEVGNPYTEKLVGHQSASPPRRKMDVAEFSVLGINGPRNAPGRKVETNEQIFHSSSTSALPSSMYRDQLYADEETHVAASVLNALETDQTSPNRPQSTPPTQQYMNFKVNPNAALDLQPDQLSLAMRDMNFVSHILNTLTTAFR